MRIADWKIGKKLMAAFLAVAFIFAIVALYQIFQMGRLAKLQDQGAKRAEDAIMIKNIAAQTDKVYTVIADAVINRNIEESRKIFAHSVAKFRISVSASSVTNEENRKVS